MSFRVLKPGVLSLLTDQGRLGQHRIGLTTGGPMDTEAYYWLNRLLNNTQNATAIEIAMGGLALKSHINTQMCVTGAPMPIYLNGQKIPQWQSFWVNHGDTIELGFASQGLRSYLSVAGGFNISREFGSTATVIREGLGGLNGKALAADDELPCTSGEHSVALKVPSEHIPNYGQNLTLRVIPGYQSSYFSRLQQRRFFSSNYTVSHQSDRMGVRLQGSAISCETRTMLSEGICLGAIQIPANGQPIILMHDRQTIGGYPKIGAVLSLDLDKLAQATPGTNITFEAISADCAHNLLCLAKTKRERIQLLPVKSSPDQR